MDDIYKKLNKEQKIEMVYDLTLQNTNGRETENEMYKLGIEACYDELCDGEKSNENSGLTIPCVRLSLPESDRLLIEFYELYKKMEATQRGTEPKISTVNKVRVIMKKIDNYISKGNEA